MAEWKAVAAPMSERWVRATCIGGGIAHVNMAYVYLIENAAYNPGGTRLYWLGSSSELRQWNEFADPPEYFLATEPKQSKS